MALGLKTILEPAKAGGEHRCLKVGFSLRGFSIRGINHPKNPIIFSLCSLLSRQLRPHKSTSHLEEMKRNIELFFKSNSVPSGHVERKGSGKEKGGGGRALGWGGVEGCILCTALSSRA